MRFFKKNKKDSNNADNLKEPIHQPSDPISPNTAFTKIVSEEDTMIMGIQSSKQSPASLLLLNGPKDLIGVTWTLKDMLTTIGRSRQMNDICIPYDSLSKVHFQIEKDSKGFHLVDLNSTNKTYLNDKEIMPHQKMALKNNSYIRASHLIFKFLDKGNIETFSSKQILDKSQIDTLTQAGNRQLLTVKGPEYFYSNQKLSLLVFDIDNFKSTNDSLGHMAGDQVLKTLSQYVLELIRENDLFIRYGGDEFCVFTPNSLRVAQNMADRIIQKIQSNVITFQGQKIPLSISIGLAEKSPSDKDWKSIYHRADQHSYKEKRAKKAAQS